MNAPELTGAIDRRLAILRGNCMGAAVLLIVEFGIGTGVNLYVAPPLHRSFLDTVFGPSALAAHGLVGLLLFGAAAAALVRAIRSGKVVVFTAVGLAAIVAAGAAGASFAADQADGASLAMALATAVAMFCYLGAVFNVG